MSVSRGYLESDEEERNLKVTLLIAKDKQRLGSEGKEGSVVLATNEIN